MKVNFSERDQKRVSIFLTVLLIIDFMNFMIVELFGIGGMIINLGILGLVLLMQYKTVVKINIPPIVLVSIITVSIYYVVTRQLSSSTLFGRNFLYYFCVASLLGMYKCDTERFLKYLSLMTLLILPFYNSIFIEMNSTKYNTGIAMGLSYAMFPMLLGSLFHFVFYRDKAKVWQYGIYIIAAFLLINLILKGTRGILLSVVVAIALIFLKGGAKSGTNGVKVAIVAICSVLIAVFFYDILEWLKDFLDAFGIDAYFLEKIALLQERGDITNGRNEIYRFSFEEIMKSPFFGHGLSTIYVNSGFRIIYSHNFILQLMYDGGLLLTVPVLLIIGRAIYCAFTQEDKNESIFTLFFIVFCLPRSFVSGDIWQNGFFWLFVMHSLKFHSIKRKIKPIKNFRGNSDDVKDAEAENKGAEVAV